MSGIWRLRIPTVHKSRGENLGGTAWPWVCAPGAVAVIFMRRILFCLFVPGAVAFHGGSIVRPFPKRAIRRQNAIIMNDFFEDAWAKYVLLRPNGDDSEDRKGWAARTPGTARTILLSSLFCVLVALPVLLTNPVVLTRLLEAAALSREGMTPVEMLEKTGRLL